MAGLLIVPGIWPVIDANGTPVSGATINFYEPGTTTPKAVYSDATLATSLGTQLTTNAGGEPTTLAGTVVRLWWAADSASFDVQVTAGASTRTWSSVVVSDSPIASLLPISNITALRATTWPGGRPSVVELVNSWNAGDGGGVFRWDSASTATDNGGTIIKETATTTGRWVRQYSGEVNARWWNIIPGVNDATIAAANLVSIHAAIAAGEGNVIVLPKGAWFFSDTIVLDKALTTLRGEDPSATFIYARQTDNPALHLKGVGSGGTPYLDYPGLHDVSIVFVNNPTIPGTVTDDKDGAVGIKSSFTSNANIKNIRVFGGLLGTYIGSSLAIDMEDVRAIATSVPASGRWRGHWIDGTSANPLGYASPNPSAILRHLVASCGTLGAGATATGIYVNGQAADMWLMDPETGGAQYGIDLAISDIASNSNLDILVRHPIMDGYTLGGLRVRGSGAIWGQIAVSDVWCAPSSTFSGAASIDIGGIRGINFGGHTRVAGVVAPNHTAFKADTVSDCHVTHLDAKECGMAFDLLSVGSSSFNGAIFHSGAGAFAATRAAKLEFFSKSTLTLASSAGVATVWTNGIEILSGSDMTIDATGIGNSTNKVFYGSALTRSGGYAANVRVLGLTGYRENSNLQVAADAAIPAGGDTAVGIQLTAGFVGFYVGSGAPTLSAAKGSFYSRTDGLSTSTRLYVNTDGATGWTNVTTAT